MIYVLNTSWKDSFATVGERLFLGLTMTLVGISIVLVVLVLVSFMVSLISRLLSGKKQSRPAAKKAAVQTAEIRKDPNPEPVVKADSAKPDAAVIAAISAAVEFMLADEKKPYAGFKIRKIRRV